MNYEVLFDEPGEYRVWVLRNALSADDDSFHVGLDGSYQFTDNNDPEHTAGVFRWRNTGGTIAVDDISRAYTITIAGREDGIAIDKIFIRKVSGSNGDTDWPSFQGAVMKREVREIEPPVSGYFSESFNGYANGAFTSGGFWTTYGDANGGNTIEIVSDPNMPGNKLLHMKKGASGGLGLFNSKATALGGVFTIEARVMRTSATSIGQWSLYTYNNATFNTGAPQSSSGPVATVAMAPNGSLRTHNVRNSTNTVNIGTTPANVWKLVQIVVNMDTGLYDYYVDGEQVLTAQTLRTWSNGYLLDRVHLYTSDTPPDDFYADYINVYKGGIKQPSEGGDERLTNPIVHSLSTGAADPWVVYQDGYYYYCRSVSDSSIGVAKAQRLQDIGAVPMVTVYAAPSGTMYSREHWAPELHYLDGKWYIYYAADDGANANHRMYVLESNTGDAQGAYTFKGKITSDPERWAIDGTVAEIGGEKYFVWSGWEGTTDGKQDIYIAHMSNPWTIDGSRVKLSSPEYDWERVGSPLINEGPQILQKDGRVFIIYSASVSWLNAYCLGMLSLRPGGDPLTASDWIKSTEPVFSMAPSAYGAGHASFTVSPDGTEDWIVYHAFQITDGGWTNRSVRAQKFGWHSDGTPDFGEPLRYGDAISAPSGTPEGLGMGIYENAMATADDVLDFNRYGGTWALAGGTYNVDSGSAGEIGRAHV
jgi:GH43 family beta-xylosidase